MLLNCGVGEDSWESLGLQGDPTSPFWRRSVLGVHWKDWCWSWNSNTLATWYEEFTHLERPWYWERLRAGGEGDDREWDGWMTSPTQFSSVAQSCPTLCDPMNRSTPGLPVLHRLLEHQTQDRRIRDAIQLFHPLSSPSPPAFNLSWHQGLFQWVGSSHQVAKILKL